jgi:hypothetical protein
MVRPARGRAPTAAVAVTAASDDLRWQARIEYVAPASQIDELGSKKIVNVPCLQRREKR